MYGRLNVTTAWSKAHLRRSIVLGILVLLAIDWVIVDRWGIKGSVFDIVTGHRIADAWVLAEFDGEEPLINIPYGPDPAYRIGKCMGTRLTRTDHRGRFRFDALTFNRPLAEKSAHITVFKSGWLAASASSEISSSLWAISPSISVALNHGPGERQSVRRYQLGDPQSRLPMQEHTRSDELFDTEGVVIEVTAKCGSQGLLMAIAAMTHALEIAATYDERERVRAACGYAKKHISAETNWPFDCENLQFENPVSDEVLAVEAEVAADRRMRLEKYSEGQVGHPLP